MTMADDITLAGLAVLALFAWLGLSAALAPRESHE